MKTGGGRYKGFGFEREQSRSLSLWVSDNKDKDLFWRNPTSGSRASNSKVTIHYGDISLAKHTLESEEFIKSFSVEVKRYKTLDLLGGWLNENSDLGKWWVQCVSNTPKELHPLLIVKPDRKPTLMGFSNSVGKLLFDRFIPYVIISSYKYPVIILYQQKDIFSIKWKEFYSVIKQLEQWK